MKLLHNARIHTFDPAHPSASAVLIDNGRILAVGGDELLETVAAAQRQNLEGRAVLPGLVDSHVHFEHYALGLQKVNCETDSLAECLHRVEERARLLPPQAWLLGHGWNQNSWQDVPAPADDRVPGFGNLSDLDGLSGGRPIYLTAKSLHAAWANSAALKLAGITADTPDPVNGKIQRDSRGQPTGILLETAMDLVGGSLPQPGVSEVAAAIREAQEALWRMGLTGLHDFDRRTCFMALQQLHARGELKMRVVKNIPVEDLPHASALGLRTGFGDDTLRVGNIKIFMDGALGPRTAAMLEPYAQESENRGILNMDAEELFELGRQAADSGLGLAVHAIGDRANHVVLDGLEHLRTYERQHGLPAGRHRIEHVQVLHPDDAGRLAKLDVTASMQPIHATSDMHMADQYWGERAALSYAWRTQLEHGARLAFGSDAPVESPNPFRGLHAAVTRQRADGSPGPQGWRPEQRLTLQEAWQGFTAGPAYLAGMESGLGRLAPQYLADLIVLERDPFAIVSQELVDLRPTATMVGGEWVWQQ
jgi:hypothetical protein